VNFKTAAALQPGSQTGLCQGFDQPIRLMGDGRNLDQQRPRVTSLHRQQIGTPEQISADTDARNPAFDRFHHVAVALE
jgi:hypothetical protein